MCFALVFTPQLLTTEPFFFWPELSKLFKFFPFLIMIILFHYVFIIHPCTPPPPSVRPSCPVRLAGLNVPTPLMIEFLLVFSRRSVAFSPFPLLFPLLSLLL